MEGLLIIERNLREHIESHLKSMGLMFKIFSRIKDLDSIKEKVERKNYKENGRKITDIIGFRVTLYFEDDVSFAFKYFKEKFEVFDDKYDPTPPTVFEPIRKNLTCYMDKEYTKILSEVCSGTYDSVISSFISNTYEIQFRTTLSEGWHEVEHNMRYKCKDEWVGLDHEGRMLNGIYAALESHDHFLLKLFEDLSYSHYKNCNWEAMIRNKFRLRFQLKSLNEEIGKILSENQALARKLFKIRRPDLLEKVCYVGMKMPMTIDGLVYLCNHLFLKDEKLFTITPSVLKEDFVFYFSSN